MISSLELQYTYLKVTVICCESIEFRRSFMKGVALNCMMVLHTFIVFFIFVFSCCSWE